MQLVTRLAKESPRLLSIRIQEIPSSFWLNRFVAISTTLEALPEVSTYERVHVCAEEEALSCTRRALDAEFASVERFGCIPTDNSCRIHTSVYTDSSRRDFTSVLLLLVTTTKKDKCHEGRRNA